MKRRTIRPALLASCLGFLLCAAAVSAQERPAQPEPRDLAVQIVGRTYGPAPVLAPPSEGGFIETIPPPQRADWKQPAGAVPLTRVRLRSRYEGAGVRVNVAVVFDDSEPADAPGPKYGPREQALASYLAQEGELVTVGELTRYGFEPLQFKLVKAVPRQPEPVALQPQLVNSLKSVTVVSFESSKRAARTATG
jgi:hypothetical protein